jgi:maltose O-acetyltransferase
MTERAGSGKRLGRSVFHAATGLVCAVLPGPLRGAGLRCLGVHIGRHTTIGRHLLLASSRLEVGDRVFVNAGVIVDNKASVIIEDDAAIGPGALITTAGHDMSSPRRRQGPVEPAPVHIGRGAWIGARAVVLPGVTVGEGSVVAAGAVVTRDCKPHTVYAGVPARPIREL